MTDCIFCKIANDGISAFKVYEDADVLAFLDIHPINDGHVLVIPKQHVRFVQQMDDQTYQNVMTVVKKIMLAIEDSLQPSRVGVIVEGFDVDHAHVKVVPLNNVTDIKTTHVETETDTDYFLKIQQKIVTSSDN